MTDTIQRHKRGGLYFEDFAATRCSLLSSTVTNSPATSASTYAISDPWQWPPLNRSAKL